MDPQLKAAIFRAVQKEPLARRFDMALVALETGRSVVEMDYDPSTMDNIYQRAHGGAVYALIDEAFETASQTHGTVAVALNVTVTYHRPPEKQSVLRAESREIHRTRKTATYDIKVTDEKDHLIASCLALAYRKSEKLPFLEEKT